MLLGSQTKPGTTVPRGRREKSDIVNKRGQSDTAARQAGSQAGRQAGPLPLDLTSGWKQPESDNDVFSLKSWRQVI